MNRNLVELLACTECGSGLLLEAADSDDISEGVLHCPGCSRDYPIQNGIPQMLPAHLAQALQEKSSYLDNLRTSINGEKTTVQGERDVERFMWEHYLYGWGKEVIYRSSEAAERFSSHSEREADSLRRLLWRVLGDVQGKRILYVGSGNDLLLSIPLERDGAFMVNLDIVSDCLEDLMGWGAGNCVCGDARRLPFHDEAFDAVFSKGSIHHSHPIVGPQKEMSRVLGVGGHIIIAEPRKVYEQDRSGLGRSTPYESGISIREVAQALSSNGISQLKMGALIYAPPRTPSPIARLWEGLGNALPWLMNRFAFEFSVCGRKEG